MGETGGQRVPNSSDPGRSWWDGPGPCGLQQVSPGVGRAPGVPHSSWDGRGQRTLWPSLAEVLPLDCSTLSMLLGEEGGKGMGRDHSHWLNSALFLWGNVWYVWYLGVYFPGCSWVPGVEMWLLHMAGGGAGGPGCARPRPQSWMLICPGGSCMCHSVPREGTP